MRVLLLDSASLYYRSYFALPDSITDAEGRPVNAVRGFLDTIAAIVRERSPQGIVACWDDDWRPQWRVDLLPSYKTHRVADAASGAEETPDTLSPQVEVIIDLLGAFGIPVVGHPHAEADDVIATLAARFGATGDVDIASGDRDLVQLVTDRVTLLYTGGSGASRGGRPWLTLDPAGVRERFGVDPGQYADIAVLRGDPSDGLPGVAGIGEKTAVTLVRAFGSLDGVLAAAEVDPPQRPMTPRLRSVLLAAADEVRRADQVVRLGPVDALPQVDPRVRPTPDAEARASAAGVGAAGARLAAALATALA